MATEERVLCFKRKLFDQLGEFQGICLDVERYLPVITSSNNLCYLNRSDAEVDRSFKQLIPYVLIFWGRKILRYRRGKKGQESRLHGLYSIGIGGHISEDDHGLFSSDQGYQEGMRRELMEEVAIGEVKDAAVGLINDDDTDVGAVHFGVVHVLTIPDPKVARGRDGITGLEFVSLDRAVSEISSYESWSQICIENIDKLLSRAADRGIDVLGQLLI
ncbi:MAG: hypothetical protein DF168_00091 [Candidatus Moanabacter tarae]|uniref:Nudix hydrolase domain-containing protein n=1 Tax=Candidatus Moanibacter tarae TaxID=2200854 RepID=A0A2Z4AAT0_9BACT|nr:MAG: hypothetical protein DF168_00091 [Candidatus Moanabacter tarae]|tara:strand:+ start:18984 stop:19634 length:651 start_codon:yes stop_codon:yes gene_type:complete